MTAPRRPEEPSLDPIPAVIIERHLPNTRVGVGLCWSLLVAEIEAERTRPAPNPWSPEDPEGAAA